jgi:hypothetical protein
MISPTEEWLMAHSKKALIPFLLIITILGILVQYASATTTQFTVYGGKESTVKVNLAAEDHVLIKFNVVGQTENTIDFKLTDPHENATAEFINKGDVSYTFVCAEGGDYTMHFSNFSLEAKLITLEYEIEHYFFGLPQMLFMVLVVVVICVAAVAVFILMGKPR